MKWFLFSAFLLFIGSANGQVDMFSSNNDIQYGFHIGGELASLNYEGEGSEYINFRFDAAKFGSDWGIYFTTTYLFPFYRNGFEPQNDIHRNNFHMELRQIGSINIRVVKTSFGATWQPQNWLMLYTGIAVATVRIREKRYYDDNRTAQPELLLGTSVTQYRGARPELGVKIVPFRFLGLHVGYDMSYETIQYGVSLGWYGYTERSRGRRGNYRRRR